MSEIIEHAKKLKARQDAAAAALASFIRSLEPILRDGGQHHTADRLVALIAEVDSMDREVREWLDTNAAAVALHLLLGKIPGV